jgi:hypothetical protein
MGAYGELMAEMQDGEAIEAIVFGPWGWGWGPAEGKEWTPGFSEPDPSPVPFALRGRVLTIEEAEPMMQSWSFFGGYGSPDCYATYIWTDRRVLWVTQYDGATGLSSAPRHPVSTMPDMPGG